jgi:pyruvate/2-oxoglutarate dehydrogenase complex dihydrolipoamide dehydrogenase (E3) component
MRGQLPIPGAEAALTFDGLRVLTRLPTSVAVVGGADTGCQLASILGDFGAQVTLVEASARGVPHEDGSPRFRRLRGLRVVRIGSP